MILRLLLLYTGLALYGFSSALLVRSGLGLNPWNILHQGVALRSGMSFGTVTMLVGAAVLLLWVPLRQRPGIGTVSNVFVIGIAADVSLRMIPQVDWLPARTVLLAAGIPLNGLAGAMYIGAGLGPGPRDGLMTGFSARSGHPIGGVRTAIELVVLAAGWCLGGTAGIGTILYALAIGPFNQMFLPFFTRLSGRQRRQAVSPP